VGWRAASDLLSLAAGQVKILERTVTKRKLELMTINRKRFKARHPPAARRPPLSAYRVRFSFEAGRFISTPSTRAGRRRRPARSRSVGRCTPSLVQAEHKLQGSTDLRDVLADGEPQVPSPRLSCARPWLGLTGSGRALCVASACE
jgi:hypothetical protein